MYNLFYSDIVVSRKASGPETDRGPLLACIARLASGDERGSGTFFGGEGGEALSIF